MRYLRRIIDLCVITGRLWVCSPQCPRPYNCMQYQHISLTYGPREAVAEVSNHNEPIGRKSGIQLVRKSMDFTFSCFVLN